MLDGAPASALGSVKIPVTHAFPKCLGSAQNVPTAYWRSIGVEGFEGTWYTLKGPLSPWPVKTATHTSKKQRFCSFTKGFAGFCSANAFKLGDTLTFEKVGLLEYEVIKV